MTKLEKVVKGLELLKQRLILQADVLGYGEHISDIDNALELLKEREGKDKDVLTTWISVEDRMSEVGQTVIGLSKYGHVSDMTLREIKNGELKHCLIFDPLGYFPGKDVKYWMPMPKDPEEDKDDDE